MYKEDCKVFINGAKSSYKLNTKQLDTLRGLSVKVLDCEGEECDLSSYFKAEVRWLKPDGNNVRNDCTIENNRVIVDLTQQMLAAKGLAKFEIILTTENGYVTTGSAEIFINELVHNDENIESTIEYQTLQNALQTVNQYDARIESKSSQVDLDNEAATRQQQFNQLNETKADKTQISSPYNFKGDCTSTELESKTGMQVNDTWYLTDLKMKKSWNGETWCQSSMSETDYVDSLSVLSDDINNLNVSTYKKGIGKAAISVSAGYKLTADGATSDSSHKLVLYQVDKSLYIDTLYGYQTRTGTGLATKVKTVLGEFHGKVNFDTTVINYVSVDVDSSDNSIHAFTVIDKKEEKIADVIGRIDSNVLELSATTVLHVGKNKVTEESTVESSGWNGSISTGFSHIVGNTSELKLTGILLAENSNYLIEYDAVSCPEDSLLVAIGLNPDNYIDCYNGQTHRFCVVRPEISVSSIRFIPKSGLTGTISNISVKLINDAYTDTYTIQSNNVSNNKSADGYGGWWNVAMGGNNMNNLVNSSRCIAIGRCSLEGIKSGNRNIGIGTFSMSQLQEGNRNIAIGADSLWLTSKGDDNVSIGKNSMGGNGTNVQRNVAVGCGAMAGQYIDGSRNTILGSNAGFKIEGTSNFNSIVDGSIALGYGAKVDKNGQMMLGSTEITEVVFCGNKKINFNSDGTVTWERLS